MRRPRHRRKSEMGNKRAAYRRRPAPTPPRRSKTAPPSPNPTNQWQRILLSAQNVKEVYMLKLNQAPPSLVSSWTRSGSSQTRPSRPRHSAGAPRPTARAGAPLETLRTWASPSRNQSVPGATSRAGTLLKLGSVMAQVALPSSASRALSTGMGGAPGDPQ